MSTTSTSTPGTGTRAASCPACGSPVKPGWQTTEFGLTAAAVGMPFMFEGGGGGSAWLQLIGLVVSAVYTICRTVVKVRRQGGGVTP